MSADLPPFKLISTCLKCGGTGTHGTEWVPRGSYTGRGIFGECLERCCRRCGYAWAEAVVAEAGS